MTQSGYAIEEEGYYCDCRDPKLPEPKRAKEIYPIRKVEVKDDGICVDCGHYATYKNIGDYARGAKDECGKGKEYF